MGDIIDAICNVWEKQQKYIAAKKEYDEAKEKVQKYTEVVEYLSSNISTAETYYDDSKMSLDKQYEIFQLNPDSAEGLIKSMFDLKANGDWKTEYTQVLQKINQGITELRMKKISVEQLVVYWEQKMKMAEAKMSLYAGF